jgi:nitrous oxidase accessory protein
MRFVIGIILLSALSAARGESLQSMIDRAEPGATLVVKPGVYGPIRTDKPIKLVGEGWPVIDGGGVSDCVVLVGGTSEIRGFVIRNSGDDLDKESTGLRVMGRGAVIENNRFENVLFGIDLKSAPDCVIRGNIIGSKALDIARRGDALRLFRSNNCLIESNTIEDGRDALLWYSNKVVVRNNISRRNRYGFHMMYANEVTLEGNEISDNSVGIYLMYGRDYVIRDNRLHRNRGPSGYGLGLKEIDRYRIESNVLSGNRVAIYMDGSPLRRKPGSAFINRNVISCNDIGFAMLPAVKGNRLEGNSISDNIEQLAVLGRGAVAGNDFTGNYWSDYTGYDANHDGVGDQPYASRKLFESLIDSEPKLRLLIYSPAHEAIEFIGRAIPAIQPEPKFTDPAPLMRPVTPTVVVAHAGGGLYLMAAGLLGVPGVVVLLLRERSHARYAATNALRTIAREGDVS